MRTRRLTSRSGRGLGGIVLSLALLWMLTQAFPELAGPQSDKVVADTRENPDTASGTVTKVVDGDTLDVEAGGKTVRVRVIGINTPETVDPRRPVQCFGKEASAHAHQLLDGAQVILAPDPTQDDTDKYGRSLRYVEITGAGDYGLAMIAGGFAHEYTYERAYLKQADYRAAEEKAEAQEVGLWNPATCAGDTTQEAKTE